MGCKGENSRDTHAPSALSRAHSKSNVTRPQRVSDSLSMSLSRGRLDAVDPASSLDCLDLELACLFFLKCDFTPGAGAQGFGTARPDRKGRGGW